MVPIASLSLVFDLLARDNASTTFRKVGDSAERASKQTSGFGAAVGGAMKVAGAALIGGGIVRGFQALYDAAAESQKIGRLTEQVIKSTGGAANLTAKQVGDLAAAISAKTGIDDEAIQSGQNLLLTFKNIKNAAGEGNDIFTQTTQIMTDMSVALGTEASGSAIQLGKALNDPIKGIAALTRVGVSFTAQQKEQITTLVETGDLMGAQKIILAELASEFGGAAEAAATPVDKLRVIAGNLAEEVGGYLLPAIEGFASFASGELIPAIRTVGGVAVDTFQTIGSVVGGAADLFGSLPGPIQAGVAALGAVTLLKGPVGSAYDTIALKALYAKDAIAGASLGLGGLKKAGAGLLAFFGGPIGLAITGVTIGLGFLVSALSDTDEATEGTVRAQNDLTAALQASKGAIDANVRAAAAKVLQDEGVLDTLEDMGIATSMATDAILGNEEALGLLGAKLQIAENAGTLLTGGMTDEAAAASAAYDALYALAGQTDGNIASAGQLAAATAETGSAMEVATGQTAEATAALEEWLVELQRISEGFVQPLSVYKDLLADKAAAEREMAEKTAAETEDASDSWEDHVGDVKVSLDELAAALQTQLDNQTNWRTNLAQIAQWAGADVAQYLAEMGAEGVDIVAQMADGTTAGAQDMREQILREIQMGGAEWTAAMGHEMAVMELIGRDGSVATVQAVARELGLGVGQVREIARKYGVELASGINPILDSLGRPNVHLSGANGFNTGGGMADGGVVDYFAKGGFARNGESHVAQIAPAGAWRVWAEPETGGEAYIPLAASKRGRSLDIWRQVGDRLGVQFQEFAFGGINDVPKPPSTAPYQMPISTAGDATMAKAYGETVEWLKANLAPVLGPGIGYQAMFAAVQKQFPYVQLHSGFRPGSITATGNLSYHASGRAIDITPDAAIFNWIAQHYRAATRELIFSPMGSAQLWNGANHLYSEPTRGDHWDHIHWAMANGGILNFHNGGVVPNLGMPDVPAFLAPGETVRTVEQEAALNQPGSIRVFIGDRELRDIVRVEYDARDQHAARNSRSWQ